MTKQNADEMLKQQVALAQAGDRDALESVVLAVKQDIHNLALRFLWHPEDAEDATQDILIRLITGLSRFRGDSQFRTWVYRIACNTLLNLKKQKMESTPLTFEAFGEDLATGLAESVPNTQDTALDALLLEEVKIGCTHAMLQCLDRDHRLAYIVGEIMELNHQQASLTLEISPSTFRKRLSRSRAKLLAFTRQHCGLLNPLNACRCSKRVETAITLRRVDPKQLQFAHSREDARAFKEVLRNIRELDEARRLTALYQSHPAAPPTEDFIPWLRQLLRNTSVMTPN